MTRQEEIQQAAEQAYPYKGGTKGAICEASIPIFIKGAEWADEHPDPSWAVRLKLEKEEWLDKACEWLTNAFKKDEYIIDGDDFYHMVKDFRKAMGE